MAHPNRAERRRKNHRRPSTSLWKRVKLHLLENLSAIRFFLLYTASLTIFYFIWLTEFVQVQIIAPWLKLLAAINSNLLGWIGVETQVKGEKIFGHKFNMEVAVGCDGIEPITYYCLAILCFSAPALSKIKGLVKGVGLLLGLAIIRLISLFIFGSYGIGSFEFWHVDLWQMLFLIAPFLLFIQWCRRILK